ncbi:restriction endonuclease subunit S [Gluconobacter kondonii]|uniref:Type I restriction-modification enzyme, S subunit n=1 Tax=Gluconobacter kondonii TaxID=941463 RepID=A0ABQ5WSU6_9PROT|nr:restriction endonuclease subunit S [Gluconobacter kondonii]GBR35167.1 type I restriction-modification system S subunit [Gluconobacter kondonii NBRC 3266]GLQ66516.1 type I restriction-modification enzyme, S subunit [Gluconobacter kondonii]
MLPEGWKYSNIGEIASNVTSGSRDWAQYYSDTGDKFVRMTNLARDGVRISENDMKFVSIPHDSTDGKRTALKNGDILISITAELGKIGLVPNGFGTAFINQHLALVRLKNAAASSTFVAYALSSKKLNQKLNSLNDAGAKAGLNLSTIRSFPIILPPLLEQKKIAAILSTWDRAIEGTEKLLANSQQQKKALMQQLLTGKKRLPGFTGEWRVCSLSDVATVQTATSKTQYICKNGARFIVDMGSVNRLGNLVCTKSTQYNEDLLPKGTLVMPKDDIGGGNIIGRTSYIDRDDLYVLGDHVYALHINNCDSKFLHFLINSNPINKNLRRMANGTAQLGLGKKDVLKQKIKIPSQLSEQKVIATVLTTADEEITTLESDLSRLRQEKKALMQQLLTGKRRVTVD